MAVGDEGTGDGASGVDVKPARFTEQAVGVGVEPAGGWGHFTSTHDIRLKGGQQRRGKGPSGQARG